VQEPINGAGKQADPVAAQVDVRLLSRQDQDFVVGEPAALVVERLEKEKPLVVNLLGVGKVELGEVNDVHSVGLEGLDEGGHFQAFGHPDRLFPLLRVQKVPRVLDVEMMGEGAVAVELLEAVAVRITADLCEGVFGLSSAEEIEDAETLPGARRRVDPGHPAVVAFGRLPDAECCFRDPIQEPGAMPNELEVVGEVKRIDELVRWRENRDRTFVCLSHDRPVPRGDSQGLVPLFAEDSL
jgi:hypothetical protein